MRIFLTGGTGLLGSHVAERLRARGDEVVALCRPSSDTTFLEGLGCELVEGALEESPDLHARRMEGCSGLVHAAAYIYGGPSLDAVRAVNVDGTRHILQGAKEAGVVQVVHISSAAVYGDPPAPITEETPLDAPLRSVDYYGQSKREGEGVAAGFHERGRMHVTIFRPPAIYGERDRLFVPKLVTFLRQPVVFLLGSGEARFGSVYAGNVAQAVELALDGRGSGGVFNVTEDVPITQRSLYEGLARELGLTPRYLSIPAGLAKFGAAVGDALRIRIPGARDLSLSRAVRVSTDDNPYVGSKALRELGWEPHYSLDEALARTARWVREAGVLEG